MYLGLVCVVKEAAAAQVLLVAPPGALRHGPLIGHVAVHAVAATVIVVVM